MLRILRSGSKRTKTIWWVLIVVTVVTFLGGFVFIFGAGMDTSRRARMTGAVGTVDGESISRESYQEALGEQRDQYHRQFGVDPSDRDARMVELQAWRGLLTQAVVTRLASREGIQVYDPEVVWSLKTQPPTLLASNPTFQTNGKFDPDKYEQALRNPGNNWAPFEALVRQQLPTRKLQQTLMSSIKISQPELRDEFLYRTAKVSATVVTVPPSMDPKLPPPGAADLDRAYQKNRSRFYSGLRAQLELLAVPRKYSDEDTRVARQLAQSLVERARRGEDFAQLARDYSEGPAADKGGVIDRVVQPAELGVMGQQIAALKEGGITDAFQDGGRFLIFKLLTRVPGAGGQPGGYRIAQIILRSHANESALRDQYQALNALRDRAARIGLGKAAAEKGMATVKTRFFDGTTPPEELYSSPGVADWGIRAKLGAVSPVFDGVDEFYIAQVAARHEPGPPSRDELAEPLRQIADLDQRVDHARSRADSVAASLAKGMTLEQAAQAAGLKPTVVKGMTRMQPEPSLAAVPEVIGALFAAPPGKVIGPLRGYAGWYFARVDARADNDTTGFAQMRGQVAQEVLTNRQRAFFNSFVSDLLAKAKVQDLREETTP